jgi:LPS-assembly protein
LFKGCLIALVVLLATPGFAAAQITDVPGFDSAKAQIQERNGDLVVMQEGVELEQGNMRFYADRVEYYVNANRMVATGNVLLIEPDHQIAADKADFNPKTRLGTFYNARGFAALGKAVEATGVGAALGPIDPDVQFYGETLEKVNVDTYVISKGGFTSCAQANPRWEMTSGSLRLRVDHYALLQNMMLKVKGVPALYLPYMYYPLSKDNRSTGFLMPSYGSSTYKGQTISNAFFWAINRSQDATLLHDWYSKTGQAIGGEYRYMSIGGSGNFRTNFLNEHPVKYVDNGEELEQPGRRTFGAFGNLSQSLGGSWYAQGRADYSSDLTVDQLYSTDIARASRRTRSYGGSLTGNTLGLRITGTFDRNEYFAENNTSTIRGNLPRINVSRPDRLLGKLPVYASVTSEYVRIESNSFDADHQKARCALGDGTFGTCPNDGLNRFDITPAIRFPFNKLAFLAINTAARFPTTFWSDSLAVDIVNGLPVPTRTRTGSGISRRYVELSSEVNGPTFVKIYDAPKASYAQRFRHSIEPFTSVVYRTAIDNFDQIVKLEGPDGIVGNATSWTYGVSTRFYAKKTADGPRAIPREVITATIRQTYNTDARSILNDAQQRERNVIPVSHFTPVSMIVRTSPFNGIDGTFRTDYDGRYSRFRSFTANAGWEEKRISLLAGWSSTRFRPDRNGLNAIRPSQFFNSDLNLRLEENRYGFIHQLNWDIKTQSLLQNRIVAYYNAQCCGFSAEYQFIDLTRISVAGAPQDSRFHFSVTLGGIGNVSNIFGALSGTPGSGGR